MDDTLEDGKLVYLPKALVERYFHLFPDCRTYHVKTVTYGIAGVGMVVPAYCLSESSLALLKEILEKSELEFKCLGPVDNGYGGQDPFWGVVRDAECAFRTDISERLQDALMEFANLLSLLTYRTVSITDHTDIGVLTPQSGSLLKYCIAQCPIGELVSVEASSLFGIGLTKTLDGKKKFLGPVLSRGEIFTDSEGTPVAQTIGGMTYIFSPTSQCNENESLAIICKSIIASWNKTRVDIPQESPSIISKEMETVMGLVCLQNDVARAYDDKIEHLNESIKDLETRLVDKIRFRDNMLSLQKGIELDKESFVTRNREGFARIKMLPEYSDLCYVKEGVEIRTKDIVIVHDDVPYRIGRFVLRFNAVCELSLWAEETHHPRGVMHPHIGRDGGVCYGNVTVALQYKFAAFDIGGATEIVFRWLTDGYMHESAETKVTEWPVATEVVNEKVKETINETIIAA